MEYKVDRDEPCITVTDTQIRIIKILGSDYIFTGSDHICTHFRVKTEFWFHVVLTNTR